VFALFLFSGFQYQKRMEQALRDRPDILVPAITQLEQIDDLIYAKQYDVARKRAETLIETLQKQADRIEVKDPYAKEKENPYRLTSSKRKDYARGPVKRLLLTLKAKAERKLKEIPVS